MTHFIRLGALTVGGPRTSQGCPVPMIVPNLPPAPCNRLAQIGARTPLGRPVTCNGPQALMPPRPIPTRQQMPQQYLQAAMQAANQMLNRRHLSPQGPQVSWLLQRKLLAHRFPGLSFDVDACQTEEFRVNTVRLCYDAQGYFTGATGG